MELKTLPDIMHNTRVKTYPDGSQVITVSDREIFREPGWEVSNKWDKEAREVKPRDGSAEDLERARRRARAAVSDLGRANDFRYFVTLTLSAEKIDRYDQGITGKQLRTWLSHQVQRRGLVYVLVPEFHKDGAIHFHGLINEALQLIDSGTIKPASGRKPRKPRSRAERAHMIDEGGQVVYNVSGWPYGFSTAIELSGDKRKAVAYVCKYIGKGSQKIGGRWYFSGGDLKRPEASYTDTDYTSMKDESQAKEWEIPRLGCKCINIEME